MDREVLRLVAHLDQARAGVRAALEGLAPGELAELFLACAAGRLGGMDERTATLVGLLAALAIHDLRRDLLSED